MDTAMTFSLNKKRSIQDRTRSIFVRAYINSVIGFQLQKYRSRSGVTIEQAAAAINQSPTRIRQMEAGVVGAPLCDVSTLASLYKVRSMRMMRFFTVLSFEIHMLNGRLPTANRHYRILKTKTVVTWFIFMSLPMLALESLWNLQQKVIANIGDILSLGGSLIWLAGAGALFLFLLLVTPLILTVKVMARGFRAVHAML